MFQKIFLLIGVLSSRVALAATTPPQVHKTHPEAQAAILTVNVENGSKTNCNNTPETDSCHIKLKVENVGDKQTGLMNNIFFPQESGWSTQSNTCPQGLAAKASCFREILYTPQNDKLNKTEIDVSFLYRTSGDKTDSRTEPHPFIIHYSKETSADYVSISNSPANCNNTPVGGKQCEIKVTLTNDGNKDAHHFYLQGFPPENSNSGWNMQEETDCVQNGDDTLPPGKTCSRIFFYKPTESSAPPSGNLNVSFLYDFGSEKKRTRTLIIPYSTAGFSAHVKIRSVVTNDSKSSDCTNTPLNGKCTMQITLTNMGEKIADAFTTFKIPEESSGWKRVAIEKNCLSTTRLVKTDYCVMKYEYTPTDMTDPCGTVSSSVTYRYDNGKVPSETTATVVVPYGKKDYVCHVNSIFKPITKCTDVAKNSSCKVDLTFTKQSHAGEGKVTDLKIALKDEDSKNGWKITSNQDECHEVNETTPCTQKLMFEPGENEIPPRQLIIHFSYKVNEKVMDTQQTQEFPYGTKE